MKALAWLIITLSLVGAIVAAVPAYSPKLTLPDEQLVGKTLNEPAGLKVTPDAPRAPIAAKGTILTPEVLGDLRAAGVKRVKVKEFSFRNWTEKWIFLLGCAGLLAGAVLARYATARQLAEAQRAPEAPERPEKIMRAIRADVNLLRQDLARLHDSKHRLDAIIDRIGQISGRDIPAFVAGRPIIVAEMGLTRFAQLMDRFAAAERQLNRAWSAAADGYEEESLESLRRASELLEEAEQRLA